MVRVAWFAAALVGIVLGAVLIVVGIAGLALVVYEWPSAPLYVVWLVVAWVVWRGLVVLWEWAGERTDGDDG